MYTGFLFQGWLLSSNGHVLTFTHQKAFEQGAKSEGGDTLLSSHKSCAFATPP